MFLKILIVILIIVLLFIVYFIFEQNTEDKSMSFTGDTNKLALQYLPDLYMHVSDPFNVKRVFVVIHPEKPLVGYHIFFDDDIDFSGDGELNDHEVVWVEYGEDKATMIYTYFHGFVLKEKVDSRDLSIYSQWGKHGLMPMSGYLDTNGVFKFGMRIMYWLCKFFHNHQRNDVSKNWPKKFEGNFDEYIKIDKKVELDSFIKEEDVLVGIEANEIISRRYKKDFASKKEWPY